MFSEALAEVLLDLLERVPLRFRDDEQHEQKCQEADARIDSKWV